MGGGEDARLGPPEPQQSRGQVAGVDAASRLLLDVRLVEFAAQLVYLRGAPAVRVGEAGVSAFAVCVHTNQ